jgi:hypothetical protein
VVQDHPQRGVPLGEHRHVAQVPGQHGDDVERDAAALEQRQPFPHLRTQQPVGVGLVVDEGADAGEARPRPQPGELGGRLVRPVQRHPGHHAGDLGVRRRDFEHRLGVRGGVVRLDQDSPVHSGRGGPAPEVLEAERPVDGGVLRPLQPLVTQPFGIPQVQVRVDHHAVHPATPSGRVWLDNVHEPSRLRARPVPA